MWTLGMTSLTGYSHRATAFATLPGTDHYSVRLTRNAWELGPLGVGSGVFQGSCRLKFKVMPPCLSRFQMVSFPG